MMSNILYIFLSHQGNIDLAYPRISLMMKERSIKDYIFIVGGYKATSFDPHTKILSVCSSDYYEGLPEKVFYSYKFISNYHLFSKYKHFIKLDDDITFGDNINYNLIKDIDYGGVTQRYLKANREYHIGRCSKGSDWNSKPYQGKFIPWCLGGYGYVLSRQAIDFIGSLDDSSYNEYASYEDLYIATLLRKNNIRPVSINFKRFFISPDHK
jgi:hypothetical protein